MEKIKPEKIEYQEEQNGPWWAIVLATILVIISVIMLIFGSEYKSSPAWMMVFWPAFIAFLVFLLINFAKMKIFVTDTELIVSYGVFKKVIKKSDIRKIEPVKLTFTNTGGIGIRFSYDNMIVYNTRWGDALKIELKNTRRKFGFTTDNQAAILDKLQTKNDI